MVVESPSKAPKIESLLGRSKWRVLATKGHICVIDDGLKGLTDLRGHEGAHIKYKTTNYKFVKDLKAAMREEGTRTVYVGTDDDREGEAIGYHVCRLAGLDPRTMPRLRFNAIERQALEAAVASPQRVNMPLVEAQMCRQAIDLVLGYTASPLLWKAVGGRESLSAGRCQTPALTLVCEKHAEAMSAKEDIVWVTDTHLAGCPVSFRADAKHQTGDKEDIEWQLDTYQEHNTTLMPAESAQRSKLSPPQPLTTSRMQQQCGMGTKRCMSAAQKLYEAGAITYHRTDSRGYCPSFATTLSEHIRTTYGQDNIGRAPIVGSGAHEAIRATDPGKMGLGKTADERRLYKFIRTRTVASGMAAAEVETLSRCLTSGRTGEKRTLRAKAIGKRLVKPGWTLVDSGGASSMTPKNYEELGKLPSKKSKVSPEYSEATPIVVGNKTPLTESRLVKTLEEVGVGRPSTYASIVNKLFDRRYAVVQDVPPKLHETADGCKRGKGEIVWTVRQLEVGGAKARLAPTPLGIKVEGICRRTFEGLLAVATTAEMEGALDHIAEGNAEWRETAVDYWDQVDAQAVLGKAMVKAKKAAEKEAGGAASATDTSPPLAELEGQPIHLKHGRYGPYLVWNGKNVKVKGKRMPNGGQAVGIVKAHLAMQAQIRDVGGDVTIRPGKNGSRYGMVGKGKAVKFVKLKECPIDLDAGGAEELREWIMSQV